MATLKELIEYSKANPQSDTAFKMQKAITGGAYDEEANQTGVDLSWAGRPPLGQVPVIQPLGQPEIKPTPPVFEKTKRFLGDIAGIEKKGLDISSKFLIKTAETFFPTLKSFGASLAFPEAEKLQAEATKSYLEQGDILKDKVFKNPDISMETKKGKLKEYIENAPEIIKTNPIFNKTLTQIAGEGLTSVVSAATLATSPAQSLKGAFGKGFLLGEAGGIAQGLQEDKGLLESALNAVPTAIAGGTFFSLGYGVGKAFEKLTKNAPETLYQSAIKQSSADFKKEIYKEAPNLTQQLIKKGIHGSDNKILTEALVGVNKGEQEINKIISGEAGKRIMTMEPIASSLDDIVIKYKNVFGEEGAEAIQGVQNRMMQKGTETTVENALKLKRDIYSVLADSAFKHDASLSQKAEALRTVANVLMENMKNVAPEISKITEQQQMWIRTAQAVEGNLFRSGRANILGLSDTILAAGGLASGSISTALAGVGRKMFETTAVKTGLAVILDRLGNIPTDTAGKIGKTEIINLLRQYMPKTEEVLD